MNFRMSHKVCLQGPYQIVELLIAQHCYTQQLANVFHKNIVYVTEL